MLYALIGKNNAHAVCHKARQSLNCAPNYALDESRSFENTGTAVSSCIVMDTDYGILRNQVAQAWAEEQRIRVELSELL